MKLTDLFSDDFELDADVDFLGDNQEDRNLVVGVVGISESIVDESVLFEILDDVLNEIMDEFLDEEEDDFEDIIIVSEAKDSGVHRVAFKIANEMGFRTVGIAEEEEDEEYVNEDEIYQADEIIFTSKESLPTVFIDTIDVLVRIGDSDTTSSILDLAELEDDLPIIERDI